MKRKVPIKYKSLQKKWKNYEKIWSITHYSIGIFAASLAFLAGSKDLITIINQDVVSILTIVSGLFTVMLTFLSPASKRKAYTEACDLLRITRLRYESENSYTEKDLNDVVDKAQQIISKR